MTTLIAAYNSDGCIGRCDAKCYNATEPECTCICGGMNHGAGQSKAIENTTELAESWMKEYDKQHNVETWHLPSLQKTLPGFEE
jgi:hypothetical protein